jgi:hypothetical protein
MGQSIPVMPEVSYIDAKKDCKFVGIPNAEGNGYGGVHSNMN